MKLLKKNKFGDLAQVHNAHCVSLYMPTHRAGQEVVEEQDSVTLKNLLKETKKQLAEYGLQQNKIQEYLEPAQKLVGDEDFWRHQSDGLSMFLYGDKFEYMTVPLNFDEKVYLGDHLFLKPLIPLLNNDERFFILVLSLGHVRFFEGTMHSIVEVEVEGLVPQGIQESIRVGTDVEQKSLQFRSGQTATGEGAIYHGHGEGSNSEKKEETLKYFREIDAGIMKMLNGENAPMLLACVDYLKPLYEEANNYKNLFTTNISGNHDKTKMIRLHELAVKALQNHFLSKTDEEKARFQNLMNQGLSSYQTEEIITAALAGRIETLFVQKSKNLWGIFNKEKNQVMVQKEKTIANTCLLNLASTATIQNGGKVHLMPDEDMPEKDTLLNAIYRYNI